MNYVFQFGKYRGKSVSAISQADPQYLLWLHHNTRMLKLTPELLKKVEISARGKAQQEYEVSEIEEGMGWDG